jgi:hypothetical protein
MNFGMISLRMTRSGDPAITTLPSFRAAASVSSQVYCQSVVCASAAGAKASDKSKAIDFFIAPPGGVSRVSLGSGGQCGPAFPKFRNAFQNLIFAEAAAGVQPNRCRSGREKSLCFRRFERNAIIRAKLTKNLYGRGLICARKPACRRLPALQPYNAFY